MALPWVTYQEYEAAGGTYAEDAFNKSSAAAHATVREIVGLNEIVDDDDLDAYRRAVRAAVAIDQAYGASGGIGESLSSVNLGRFSASMSGTQSSYDLDMTKAIRRELSGSSLLYQGIA